MGINEKDIFMSNLDQKLEDNKKLNDISQQFRKGLKDVYAKHIGNFDILTEEEWGFILLKRLNGKKAALPILEHDPFYPLTLEQVHSIVGIDVDKLSMLSHPFSDCVGEGVRKFLMGVNSSLLVEVCSERLSITNDEFLQLRDQLQVMDLLSFQAQKKENIFYPFTKEQIHLMTGIDKETLESSDEWYKVAIAKEMERYLKSCSGPVLVSSLSSDDIEILITKEEVLLMRDEVERQERNLKTYMGCNDSLAISNMIKNINGSPYKKVK